MLGDFVVCQFGANHDVMKICGRILSNTTQVTQVFEAACRSELSRGVDRPLPSGHTSNSFATLRVYPEPQWWDDWAVWDSHIGEVLVAEK